MTPFDLDYDDTPVIFLEAFPGADAEYIKFEIQPAYSKSNTAQKPPFNPEIIFDASDICYAIYQGAYILIYDKTQDIRNCDILF